MTTSTGYIPGLMAWPTVEASADIFESMNLGLPNEIATPNRRLRMGLMPRSFGPLTILGSAVGELGRSAKEP